MKHTLPQDPPAHVGDAFGAGGHSIPHIPQCIVLVIVSTHMPIPQLLSAPEHPLVHVPALQLGVAPEHIVLHAPQLAGALDDASQPLPAAPSQFKNPGRHDSTQLPLAHTAL